jgi:beta-lactamase class A
MTHQNVHMKKLIYLLLLILLIAFGLFKFSSGNTQIISPLAEEKTENNIWRFLFNKNENGSEDKDLTILIKQIKDYTQKQNGIYSVYICVIKTNECNGINETTILTAASVNKLPILAALYYEAQTGNIDLDERITVQSSDIQDYGTGIIRNEGPGNVYALKSLAQLMIEKSDNTAVYILTNKIGANQIQDLVDSWGMTQTDIANNKTSNKDMALLLMKMYQTKIANQALTTEMIGFLDDSDFENRLPALLPKDVKVYHKIGNEIGFLHDVGIVDLPNNPYYIGVMTSDVTDEPGTENAIAQISKMTYEFLK